MKEGQMTTKVGRKEKDRQDIEYKWNDKSIQCTSFSCNVFISSFSHFLYIVYVGCFKQWMKELN